MRRVRQTVVRVALRDPLLRRGWQHDGRQPMNPAKPGPRPQKVPDGLL